MATTASPITGRNGVILVDAVDVSGSANQISLAPTLATHSFINHGEDWTRRVAGNQAWAGTVRAVYTETDGEAADALIAAYESMATVELDFLPQAGLSFQGNGHITGYPVELDRGGGVVTLEAPFEGTGQLHRSTLNYANGYVAFVFADGHRSTYTLAMPILRTAHYRGVAMVATSLVDGTNRVTTEQVQTLDALGWDVCSHGYTHDNPTLMTPAELDEHLSLSAAWLSTAGIRGGKRHYGPPLACNEVVRDAALGYYRSVIPDSLGAWAVLPAGWSYTWQAGDDSVALATVTAAIDAADGNPGNVVFLSFHVIVQGTATGADTSTARLQALVDYVTAAGINVATVSDLLDGKVP